MNNVEEIRSANNSAPVRPKVTLGTPLRGTVTQAKWVASSDSLNSGPVWGLASESDSEFVFRVQGVSWWWTGRRVELLYRVTGLRGEGGAGGGII